MERFTLNIHGTIHTYDRPVVMGILNVTTDSFYAASRCHDDEAIAARVRQIIDEGADIIDVGAYSTRPGARDVSVDEETDNLGRAMSIVRREAPHAVVSVDTFRAGVARAAVTEMGCDIVNDIAGTNLDPDMVSTVASLGVPYILTHMRGTPADMMEYAEYEDVTADVLSELGDRIQWLALEGVADIIVDPGIGFAKTLEQNYRLLHDLEILRVLHRPILVGVSRKSLITRLLDISTDKALEATTALNAMCLDRGADILRVHDVRAARHTVDIFNALTLGSSEQP